MTENQSKYRQAGVDIDLAHQLLGNVKGAIRDTYRAEVLNTDGGFGGMFKLDLSRYREPVLVSSIDGVGTKLMIASMMNRHGTVGHDIVNHCVNDIACQGAEPLYFMDYIGAGKLRNPMYQEVLTGIAAACKSNGIALLGGETAEMPGMYGDDYDLVGVITGIVEKANIITGTAIRPGDRLIGLASNGLHTNGYSLARRVLFADSGLRPDTPLAGTPGSIGDALLQPHTCYWRVVRALLATDGTVHGIAHITGGGWYDNISRILPTNTSAILQRDALPCPPIFRLIEQKGNVSAKEMHRVFNMGLGIVFIVDRDSVDNVLSIAAKAGFEAAPVGHIADGNGTVAIQGIDRT